MLVFIFDDVTEKTSTGICLHLDFSLQFFDISRECNYICAKGYPQISIIRYLWREAQNRLVLIGLKKIEC